MIAKIRSLITTGSARSTVVKKNIVFSLIAKGGNVIIGLILVPLTINLVSTSHYGIWITISSIIAWFNFFDIGFGHGLRNKLAEAIAQNKYNLARIYLSTTYASISVISLLVWGVFFLINFLLDWPSILNTDPNLASELSILALILLTSFCGTFILQLITTVLYAKQESAKATLISLFTNLLALSGVLLLSHFELRSLSYLAIVFGSAQICVLLVVSLLLYKGSCQAIAPAFKYVRVSFINKLMSLGLKFFVLQIGAMILFQTNNIIIAQLFGPEKVTIYQITFKYFSITLLVFSIIISPLWSAFTEAWIQNDKSWIKTVLKKIQWFFMVLSVLTILMLLFSEHAYKLWLGDNYKIPFRLSLVVSVGIILQMWQSIYLQLVNGVSKVTLQLWLVLITSILNIPLAIFLGKLFGLEGVILSSVSLFLLFGSIMYVQTQKIVNNNAKGIWNK